MPSSSKSQQRLMAMCYAYKTGKLEIKKLAKSLQKKIIKISNLMTKKDLKDFAETKHKNLPEIKESKYINNFNSFLNEKQNTTFR